MTKRNRKKAVAPVNENPETTEAVATTTVTQPSPEQGAAKLPDNDERPAGENEQQLPTEAEERERLARELAEDQAFKGEPEAPVTPVAQPADVIHIVTPTGEKTPFAFIWSFLALNPNVPRKAQRAALYAYGLNENTVKTQISRYYKVGGDKALWLAQEKVKRAEEKAMIDKLVQEIRANKAAEEAAAAEQAASDGEDKNAAA